MNDIYGQHMPERRTNKTLFVLVPLMVIGVPVLVAVLLMNLGRDSGGILAPTPATETTHPAGATVTDAGIAFRVASVRTRERITSEAGTDTAKGRYVLVSLDVTNTGSGPRTVFANDQQLRAGGKTYAVDTAATVDSDKGPQVGLPQEANPGATEKVVVVYDVPAGVVPQAVELHGAAGSGGAVVALSVG